MAAGGALSWARVIEGSARHIASTAIMRTPHIACTLDDIGRASKSVQAAPTPLLIFQPDLKCLSTDCITIATAANVGASLQHLQACQQRRAPPRQITLAVQSVIIVDYFCQVYIPTNRYKTVMREANGGA